MPLLLRSAAIGEARAQIRSQERCVDEGRLLIQDVAADGVIEISLTSSAI